MIKKAKILIIINDCESDENAINKIEKIIKPWGNPEIYLFYTVDLSYMPPDVFAALDKKFYNKLKEKGSKILKNLIDKLKSKGFNVKKADMYFGIAAEGILRYEKSIKPDVIILCEKKSIIKKIIEGLPTLITSKSKAPVVITG